SVGLRQLHSQEIAHQDLKPANVLVFAETSSKLGDLGRASRRGAEAIHDESGFPGDRRYAPPEFQYGFIDPDWRQRRFGGDLYQLGSLAVFFFSGVHMLHLVISHLHDEHRPRVWNGSFQQAVPYLQKATALALDDFRRSIEERIKSPKIR